MNQPSCRTPGATSWATPGTAAAITAMPNMPISMLRVRVRSPCTFE
nr:hypothetical protein [Nonomuraea basaltis]